MTSFVPAARRTLLSTNLQTQPQVNMPKLAATYLAPTLSPLSYESLVWRSQADDKASAQLCAPRPLISAFCATPDATRPPSPSVLSNVQSYTPTLSSSFASVRGGAEQETLGQSFVLWRESLTLAKQPTIVQGSDTASLKATEARLSKLLQSSHGLKALMGVVIGYAMRSVKDAAQRVHSLAMALFVRAGFGATPSSAAHPSQGFRTKLTCEQQDFEDLDKATTPQSEGLVATSAEKAQPKAFVLDLRGIDSLEIFQSPWD